MERESECQIQTRAEHLERILSQIGLDEPKASAEKLLNFYGSFAALSGAKLEDLKDLITDGGAVIKALAGALRIVNAGVRETAVRSWLDPYARRFLDYLRLTLGQRRQEVLIGFFGSADGRLVKEQLLAFGDGHKVTISSGAIMRAAIAIDAPRILLVHNHPSGRPVPSNADRKSMHELDCRAAVLDYQFIDHLIVGGTEVYSLRKGELL